MEWELLEKLLELLTWKKDYVLNVAAKKFPIFSKMVKIELNVMIASFNGNNKEITMNQIKQKDSRSKTLSEAFVNSFGAYPIGYGIGIVVLPISMGWLQEDVFTANIFVTLVYATVSFVRIYYLRRIFERLGFDDNFIKLGIKLYSRTKLRILQIKQEGIRCQ